MSHQGSFSRYSLLYADHHEPIAEENEIYRKAKFEALNNHVLRFSCAFQALVVEALRRGNNPKIFSFNRAAFLQRLESARSTLNDFYEGKISLIEAEAVLRPFVADTLNGIQVQNTTFITKEALLSIQKIKI